MSDKNIALSDDLRAEVIKDIADEFYYHFSDDFPLEDTNIVIIALLFDIRATLLRIEKQGGEAYHESEGHNMKTLIIEIPDGITFYDAVKNIPIQGLINNFKNRDGKTHYQARHDKETGVVVKVTDRAVTIKKGDE